MKRTGTLYTEIQRNTGRGGELHARRLVRGCRSVDNGRLRWVAEISYHGKRYRFRSTNFYNARAWLDDMIVKFN